MRKLQQEGGAADFVAEAMQHKSTSPKKVQVADPNDLALLPCCGHVGEAKTVQSRRRSALFSPGVQGARASVVRDPCQGPRHGG